MKKITLVLFAVLFCTAAFAEKVKVKYGQLIELQNALQALDGSQQLTGDKKAIYISYDFSGSTRVKIAQDLINLKIVTTPYNETLQAILKAHHINPNNVAAAPVSQSDPANAEWDDAIKNPIEIDLKKVTVEELKLDTNQIPGSVLSGLSLITTNL